MLSNEFTADKFVVYAEQIFSKITDKKLILSKYFDIAYYYSFKFSEGNEEAFKKFKEFNSKLAEEFEKEPRIVKKLFEYSNIFFLRRSAFKNFRTNCFG